MLGEKKGDLQARVELLGHLLIALGEKPYWARVGSGTDTYCMILLRVSEQDPAWIRAFPGGAPKPVRIGAAEFVPLPLEPGARPGDMPADWYDPATGRWKATMALSRFP